LVKLRGEALAQNAAPLKAGVALGFSGFGQAF
jgi:hypothetical protein